ASRSPPPTSAPTSTSSWTPSKSSESQPQMAADSTQMGEDIDRLPPSVFHLCVSVDRNPVGTPDFSHSAPRRHMPPLTHHSSFIIHHFENTTRPLPSRTRPIGHTRSPIFSSCAAI